MIITFGSDKLSGPRRTTYLQPWRCSALGAMSLVKRCSLCLERGHSNLVCPLRFCEQCQAYGHDVQTCSGHQTWRARAAMLETPEASTTMDSCTLKPTALKTTNTLQKNSSEHSEHSEHAKNVERVTHNKYDTLKSEQRMKYKACKKKLHQQVVTCSKPLAPLEPLEALEALEALETFTDLQRTTTKSTKSTNSINSINTKNDNDLSRSLPSTPKTPKTPKTSPQNESVLPAKAQDKFVSCLRNKPQPLQPNEALPASNQCQVRPPGRHINNLTKHTSRFSTSNSRKKWTPSSKDVMLHREWKRASPALNCPTVFDSFVHASVSKHQAF